MDLYPDSGLAVAFLAVTWIIGIGITIIYISALEECLKAVSPSNRTLSPGFVWLLLIPLFNLVWHFVVVIHLARSLKNEAEQRKLSVGDGGKLLGIATSISLVLGPILNILLMIWYWIRISRLTDALNAPALYPLSEPVLTDLELETAWAQAAAFIPEIAATAHRLETISPALARSFKDILLANKSFKQHSKIAELLIAEHLHDRFGRNPVLLSFGTMLIQTGDLHSAKKLEEAVHLLGADINPYVVIDKIRGDSTTLFSPPRRPPAPE
jgi:hypothetical protein